jgi:hypothetical protein
MMHAREKSDSAIVAGKPTNQAERSAAEANGRSHRRCLRPRLRRHEAEASETLKRYLSHGGTRAMTIGDTLSAEKLY